jgi:hypothetical protein
VSLKANLCTVDWRKLLTSPGFELLPLDRAAHMQSLYLPRYPGHQLSVRFVILELNMKVNRQVNLTRERRRSKTSILIIHPVYLFIYDFI